MSSSTSSSTLDSKTSVSLTESSESLKNITESPLSQRPWDVRLNQTDPEAPLIHHDPQPETVTVTASISASTTSSTPSSFQTEPGPSESPNISRLGDSEPDTLQDINDFKPSLTESLPDYQSQTENLTESGTISIIQ